MHRSLVTFHRPRASRNPARASDKLCAGFIVAGLLLTGIGSVMLLPGTVAAQQQAPTDPPGASTSPDTRRNDVAPGTPPAAGGGQPAAAQRPPEPEKPYHQKVLADPPKSPRERAEVLANLYALLATAENESKAKEIAAVVERLWLFGHGDTVFVLVQRATKALAEKNDDLAIKLLDAVVELAPDYAEGWHQRAIVHYNRNNVSRALGDIRRVLALDQNHYKALEGLSRMLEETGRDTGALAAHRQLMSVHPHWADGQQRLRELERKAEGQGI